MGMLDKFHPSNRIARYCPVCGKRIDSINDQFCLECGTKIQTSPFQDSLVALLNWIRSWPWKRKVVIGFLLFWMSAQAGASLEGHPMLAGGCFAAIVVVAFFSLTRWKTKIKFFIWKLESDFRHKKINDRNISISRRDTERYIMSLTPRQFEEYIATMFRSLDYDVELTPSTSDGGKDLIVRKNGITYYVECKQWNTESSIGRPVLQKLIGAAVSDGVTHVIFVSTCKFAKTAIEAARENQMVHCDLWGMRKILNAVEEGKHMSPFRS